MWWREELGNVSLSEYLKFHLKFFRKIILKPLQFREDSSSARITEQMQILQHLLECISKDLKELWIA